MSAQFYPNVQSSNGTASAIRALNAPFENAFIRESQPLNEIVHVFGEVDVLSVSELQTVIEEAARGSGGIIVDLSPCAYIDSSTLTMLVRMSKAYAGRFLIVVQPNGLVHRVLAITNLLDHLPIVNSLDGYTV